MKCSLREHEVAIAMNCPLDMKRALRHIVERFA